MATEVKPKKVGTKDTSHSGNMRPRKREYGRPLRILIVVVGVEKPDKLKKKG
jgi:hypothetical protein